MTMGAQTIHDNDALQLIDGLKSQILPLLDDEKFDDAYELVEPNLELLRGDASGCYLVGLIQKTRQERDDAIKWLKRCVDLTPSNIDANFQLGMLLNEENYHQAAIPFLNRTVKMKPQNARAWMEMGLALQSRDRVDMAISAYENAYSIDADLSSLRSKMAICYLSAGKKEAASKFISEALNKEPDNHGVFCNYVTVHNGKIDDELLKRFEEYEIENKKNGDTSSGLSFALANVYEKRNNLEKACDYYDAANYNKAQVSGYSDAGRDEIYSGLRAIASDWKGKDNSEYGIADEGAIFVVGMPRSGTTLTQQIIGAHSQATGAGELLALRGLAVDGSMKLTKTQFPESLSKLSAEESMELANGYMQAIRSFGDTKYIVDKMPGNFLHIPMIWRMLPNAKVIHTNREPIDVCWSMWRQSFKSALDYCYDPKWMAEYYFSYLQQMESYRESFPDFIYDISYEKLTSNPEEESRKLIDFCGLEWEDGVMDYHKNKQSIRTASINQANKPVYTTSQRSWEPVKHRIRPIIEALHDAGVETCVSRGEVSLD